MTERRLITSSVARVLNDMTTRERYGQNAVGDFYVQKDVCLQCMAPEFEAPELMGFDKATHNCYFKKQPTTAEELEHAIAAVWVSEIQGLRYAGEDKYVLRRLKELGAADCCDALSTAKETAPEANKPNFIKVWLWKLLNSK
jgi:hypothetical protein